MKCYYEVLNVPRDADDSQIKSAYRKLALKLHPDKNLDNPELAKEQFQVVQQAYEVLSDRQERAWYDKHREQILRGANSEFQDNSLDVFQYFTTTCFKGYGDDENGFYTVYRNVFEKIAKEDMEFMENKEEFCEIPGFGNSKSSFETVAEFYAYWSCYSTKKSYCWLDTYDIKEIRERKIIKLAEKENKKVRQAAKKERNEEIRNLVAFVKKRDKRVQAQKKLQEQKLLENKQKSEQLRKQKKLERQQELNNSSEQPEWAKFDNFRSELEEIEKNLAAEFGEDLSETDSEDIDDNLYCIACNKVFKTPKAFQNHESSRKHKENVEIIKEQMLLEDEEMNEASDDDVEDYGDSKEENHSDLDEAIDNCLQNGGVASESDDLEEINEKVISKRKKKQKSQLKVQEPETSHSELLNGVVDFSSDDIDFVVNQTKQKKKNKKKSSKSKQEVQEVVKGSADEDNDLIEVEKSKQKRNKKEKKKKVDHENEDLEAIDINHNCVTCKSSFSSKNKLFDHLKKTGHGVYLPPTVKNGKKKGSKEK